ncbi:hypothetical protein SIID45300_02390 [Candidatus Magnetaquicoccaceae bacterium FCR-1]|uniref:Phage protein n=1 Tax=Candidatus Magnetaquiglobus chichijimensis TaxID=3141448 RepID=A0ABQ0CAY4_9PROT
MFQIAKDQTFSWTIDVTAPHQSNQQPAGQFTAHMRLLGIAETTRLAGESDAAFINAIVTGWDDVLDQEGQPMPFTPENLAVLIDMPNVRLALVRGYHTASSGGAREKN